MTPQQAKELLPIITAFAEGKAVEYLNIEGEWETATKTICFDCQINRYRIKRDPIKAWAVVFKSGPPNVLFSSKDNAELYCKDEGKCEVVELEEKPSP